MNTTQNCLKSWHRGLNNVTGSAFFRMIFS
jgi:hypothetical protein